MVVHRSSQATSARDRRHGTSFDPDQNMPWIEVLSNSNREFKKTNFEFAVFTSFTK